MYRLHVHVRACMYVSRVYMHTKILCSINKAKSYSPASAFIDQSFKKSCMGSIVEDTNLVMRRQNGTNKAFDILEVGRSFLKGQSTAVSSPISSMLPLRGCRTSLDQLHTVMYMYICTCLKNKRSDVYNSIFCHFRSKLSYKLTRIAVYMYTGAGTFRF